jgi:hypothetical protein
MAKIVSIFARKEIKSNDALPSRALYLDNFGSLIGFRFNKSQGSAEVLMTFPEIQRILEELAEYEKSKKEPNRKIIDALEVLDNYLFGFPLGLVANVVIGQSHVKIEPDPPTEIIDE